MPQLNVNDLPSVVRLRHKAFQIIRSYFDERSYHEIDAPILIEANAVEAYIDPIAACTHDPISDHISPKYLSTSPEIHMKRLLSAGLDRIYSLGHVFRDREGSPQHLNEFMMLEWYRAGIELNDLITECEELFLRLSRQLCPTDHRFQEGIECVRMAQAWERFAGIDLDKALREMKQGDSLALVRAAKSKGAALREDADFEDAFAHVMLKHIEPKIGQTRPCALIDWPAQTAALARLCPDNPLYAQRFEIYLCGIELANAFNELTNAQEQRSRFQEANEIRRNRKQDCLPIHEGFLRELEKMPTACGIAVGIDRLIALLSGVSDLKAITPFAK